MHNHPSAGSPIHKVISVSSLYRFQLDIELHSGGALYILCIGRQCRLNRTSGSTLLIDNLRATVRVELCVEHAIEVIPDGLEKLVALDPRYQVI